MCNRVCRTTAALQSISCQDNSPCLRKKLCQPRRRQRQDCMLTEIAARVLTTN